MTVDGTSVMEVGNRELSEQTGSPALETLQSKKIED
jgi:hypothetical protein